MNSGGTEPFILPLTMPGAATAGDFPVVVTPPATLTDSNPANNAITLPYQVAEPFADLRMTKSKSPGSGPQAPGTTITNTLTVTNDASSLSAATYNASNPLRVVDYVKPAEISGTLTGVTAGWTCAVTTGVTNPPFTDDERTTEVVCTNNGPGTLAIGDSIAVSFSSTIANVSAPVTLSNYACTGGRVLTALGGTGPSPADPVTSNDCDTAGSDLVATDVVTGDAVVNIVKASSVDGVTWVDPVASAPNLPEVDNTMHWRFTITTPSVASNAAQKTIPTLNLGDNLPGILNTSGATAPAHNFVTPGATLTITGSGYASHNCPATLAAGSGNLNCAFTDVAPDAAITVQVDMQRALSSGTLTNTATLTSPNALLSGTMSDAAAVNVLARYDVAMTSKTVTPLEPKVGEIITFTLGAQNLSQDSIPIGQFTITDDLHTGTPDLTDIAYDYISASGTGMTCSTSAQPGDITRVSCVNTTAVARFNVRTITIQARIKKPSGLSAAANSTLYTGVTNTANVTLGGGLCEYRTETTTLPASASAACNDAASVSNNSKVATFDVKVPAIDLQQGKAAVYPVGQTSFRLGDTLRYRFSVRNAGPSRAEEIEMTDILDPIPAGFMLALAGVPQNINSGSPDISYTFVSRTVTCAQPGGANTNVVCHLDPVLANSWLDANQMVSFELDFTMTGTATGPVVFGNRAYVCADETNTYEASGKCSPDPLLAGNNLESVNDTIFPAADLTITKATQTVGPVDVGELVEYRMVLTNNGTATVEKMRMVDTLPAGFEWVSAGAQTPVSSAAAGATLSGALTVSGAVPAHGTDNVCYISNAITSVTLPTQRQAITCDVGGTFPATGTVTITLWARAKAGVYAGPWLTDRQNDAEVQPGRDSSNNEVSVDSDTTNNTASSQVQVRNASIAGRVFVDVNNNGDTDGGDTGLAGVKVYLTGTDINGNSVIRQATTNASGDYVFDGLAPSDAAGYTITQDQSTVVGGYNNGLPQANTSRPVRNGSSTAVTDKGTASIAAGGGVIAGVVLGSGGEGVQFDFPEITLYMRCVKSCQPVI